jgi:DNA-directed RNA polymerase specialized sigma24 family protein
MFPQLTITYKETMKSKLRKPIGLVGRADSSKQINLRWDPASPSEGIVSYHIERNCPSATKSGFKQIAAVVGTTYTDAHGLFSATEYEYRARAINVSGDVSPYSAVSKIRTQPRQPALKEFWTKVNATLGVVKEEIWWESWADDGKTWHGGPLGNAYDSKKTYRIYPSPYVGALSQLKAIEAALHASNERSWPSAFCGKGWDTDVHFAITGYENAKTSLLTFDDTKGTLADRLFYSALSSIKEAAKEEANSWGGKRVHKKDVRTPRVSNFTTITEDLAPPLAEVVISSLSSRKEDPWDGVNAAMTADKLLDGLEAPQAHVLRLRIGEEATLTEVAGAIGRSKSAVDRDVKILLAKIQRTPQVAEARL